MLDYVFNLYTVNKDYLHFGFTETLYLSLSHGKRKVIQVTTKFLLVVSDTFLMTWSSTV